MLLARGPRRSRTAPQPTAWPSITVLVAAYREAAVIEAKVADTLANGYPGVLEVLVVADDDATADAARRTSARVVAPGERLGKSAAVNLGVGSASGEIVVITDANAFLEPGSLASLVRWFDDPTVGAVAGEKRVRDSGEGAYWRYESWLKQREFEAGTTISVVGELAAFRRAAWRDIPDDCPIDDLWLALDVIDGGLDIAYEPMAIATEDGTADLREEWERRTRNLAGMLDVCWRRRDVLRPGGRIALQLWGHKVLRSTLGPVAHLLLLGRALRWTRRSRVAGAFVAAHAVAVGGLVAARRGSDVPGPVSAAGQVVFLHGVALGGVVRYLRGDRPSRWPKPERTTGPAG